MFRVFDSLLLDYFWYTTTVTTNSCVISSRISYIRANKFPLLAALLLCVAVVHKFNSFCRKLRCFHKINQLFVYRTTMQIFQSRKRRSTSIIQQFQTACPQNSFNALFVFFLHKYLIFFLAPIANMSHHFDCALLI